jgi:hypothetical protein
MKKNATRSKQRYACLSSTKKEGADGLQVCCNGQARIMFQMWCRIHNTKSSQPTNAKGVSLI